MKKVLDRMMEVKKQQNRKQQAARQPYPDDDVELEMNLPKMAPLNTDKGVFDQGREKYFGGINTKKSVFDSTAVFHTKQDKASE